MDWFDCEGEVFKKGLTKCKRLVMMNSYCGTEFHNAKS